MKLIKKNLYMYMYVYIHVVAYIRTRTCVYVYMYDNAYIHTCIFPPSSSPLHHYMYLSALTCISLFSSFNPFFHPSLFPSSLVPSIYLPPSLPPFLSHRCNGVSNDSGWFLKLSLPPPSLPPSLPPCLPLSPEQWGL